MLGDSPAIATVPVRDIKAAARFYEDTLGLRRSGDDRDGVINYQVGGSHLLVYESTFAGTNHATAVTWPEADVDGTVRALAERGVKFERYDMPNAKHEGDVHVMGDMRTAWFKDPDGNIHAVVSG